MNAVTPRLMTRYLLSEAPVALALLALTALSIHLHWAATLACLLVQAYHVYLLNGPHFRAFVALVQQHEQERRQEREELDRYYRELEESDRLHRDAMERD